ncbi:hypothetical protein AB0D27_07515 [Streptomyces sp. NPDC048415]|uniref:hypothetical protein n=1 Tax=Streptomyces sp. NPDC048415 TaxID=3154822 RepID=UPI0034455286
MVSFLIPLATAVLIIATSTTVLIRRDRRRMEAGAETLHIESAATRGLPDTRRRVHAYQQRFLRERD